MISTPTAFRKPVITACGTKRTRKPILNRPIAVWITPIMSASVNTACSCWSAGTPYSALPTARDRAPVVEMCIIWELVKSAPMGVATIIV